MNGAAGESTAVVRRLTGEMVEGERKVSTDHANLSIAVGERYIVKWFHTPAAHASFDVVEHLAAVGFPHMPRFVGVVDDGGSVVATVSELVPGVTDGWQWYVADVIGWVDGAGDLDGLVRTAARMGSITAELHDALAGDSAIRGSLDPARAWVRDRRRVAVEQTTGEAGDRLRARLRQVDAALGVLDSTDDVTVQRIHGDLHAGQFLRSSDDPARRLLLTDFDGDPLAAPGRRPDLEPVERDVASLLQSIDHVGRIAARRRGGADVTEFVDAGIDAALEAYQSARRLDRSLLFALRVAQELHEYAYAATRLPIWGYVPDAALVALFPDEDGAR
ncbi:MAG: phosphotransferase [Actinobacteria bacterium]|nr:phosphotransferase [Actinomycetota bacterium]